MMSNTDSGIKVVQLNCKKSRRHTEDIIERAVAMEVDVLLLQEPYINVMSRHMRLSSTYFKQVMPGKAVRAAVIVLRDGWKGVCLAEHSNEDFCAVNLPIGGRDLTFVSMYIEPRQSSNDEIMDEMLSRLDNLIKLKKDNLFIGGDLNSHHAMWGEDKNDNRGERVADLINSCNLYCVNQGKTPTFRSFRDGMECTSIVDLTLMDAHCLTWLKSWRVLEMVSDSDHCPIETILSTSPHTVPRSPTHIYDNIHANWDIFGESFVN